MAWSRPYLAILTSAASPYKEAKGNDSKAKILAATVNEIMEKAQEDSHALPDDLKKVCLHACLFPHSTDSGKMPIETLTQFHNCNKLPHSIKAIEPTANSSKGQQPHGGSKYHKIY